MDLPRSSGILLHVTSLPGPFGIGELGGAAYEFVDFLHRAGQRVWQVLPLGPSAQGNSPYTSLSAFAGSPLLISAAKLVQDGFLDPHDLDDASPLARDDADYDQAARLKAHVLNRSFERFLRQATADEREAFSRFECEHAWWLDDYALFAALVEAHGGRPWSEWEPELKFRRPEAITEWREKLAGPVQFARYVQYQFFRQWHELRAYAQQHGVRLFGDLPLLVGYESADVWLHPELFHLDVDLRPTVAAGVPPDYFSQSGQLWGNPLYRWEAAAANGFAWWADRFRHAVSLFDLVRLDHFRGFEAYWEVPAQDTTAEHGRWVKGPGAELFQRIQPQLPPLPIVAEDLGWITPEVHALRDTLGFPGLRVLQFGFSAHGTDKYHLPHEYPRHCVVYTGTHDNNTLIGWLASGGAGSGTASPEDAQRVRELVLQYVGGDGREIHWDLIRWALGSVADLAIVPLQDVLGLDSTARMNTPGKPYGNWTWRLRAEMLSPAIEGRLGELTAIYSRCD